MVDNSFDLTGLEFDTAYIEITRVCDLICRHCYHARNRKNPKTMEVLSYRKLITALAEHHKTGNFVILGGEPMTHPHVAEMIRFASHFGNVDICTNGKDPEKLSPVVKRIRKYRVSLDGLRGTHDSIRGKGSYDRALDSLKRMISLGCVTSVTTTVHKGNKDEVIALVKKMDGLGVRDIQIQQLMGSEETDGLETLSEEEVLTLGEKLEDLFMDLDIEIDFQKEKPISRKGNKINRLTIGPEGDVTFSPDNLGRNKYIIRFDFDLGKMVVDIDRLIKQT